MNESASIRKAFIWQLDPAAALLFFVIVVKDCNHVDCVHRGDRSSASTHEFMGHARIGLTTLPWTSVRRKSRPWKR